MAQNEAFFSLTEPRHLLAKLEHDYERLRSAKDPLSVEAQYAAFDFFVTAEHMCDWQAKATGTTLAQQRDYPDGPLVWDVASGAKHFRLDNPKHTTVKATRKGGTYFGGGYFGGGFFGRSRLVVQLDGGLIVAVFDVATRVLEHWRAMVR